VAAAHLIDRRIGELSGGELQRVLLAMAMIPAPDILLMDEPVSAVDVSGMQMFYKIVDDLREEHDVSVVMVSHDLEGIAPHADRMVLLNKRVIAQGVPAELLADKKLMAVFGEVLTTFGH
jgi:zinc transport system ATP-binding protein